MAKKSRKSQWKPREGKSVIPDVQVQQHALAFADAVSKGSDAETTAGAQYRLAAVTEAVWAVENQISVRRMAELSEGRLSTTGAQKPMFIARAIVEWLPTPDRFLVTALGPDGKKWAKAEHDRFTSSAEARQEWFALLGAQSLNLCVQHVRDVRAEFVQATMDEEIERIRHAVERYAFLLRDLNQQAEGVYDVVLDYLMPSEGKPPTLDTTKIAKLRPKYLEKRREAGFVGAEEEEEAIKPEEAAVPA